jgi:hypothetical protein
MINTDLQNDINEGHIVHLTVIHQAGQYFIAAVGNNPAGGVMVRLYNKSNEAYTFGRCIFTSVEHVREALAINFPQPVAQAA